MNESLECMGNPDDCSGPVEMHSLDGLKYWPRCRFHFAERMRSYENSIERYANSDVAPGWFDPTAAGERWDEDY